MILMRPNRELESSPARAVTVGIMTADHVGLPFCEYGRLQIIPIVHALTPGCGAEPHGFNF
jgi:hypothetical protein